MAKIHIDYGRLEDAARYISSAAKEMEEYAAEIDNRVSGPIGNLTDGATQYTSSVSELANRKARELREKAGKYRDFEGKVKTLASNAQQADKDVATHLKTIKEADSVSLKWYQKIMAKVYELYSNTIGQTDIGRFLNHLNNSAIFGAELYATALQKARDFFVYGKGRYILNAAGAVLGVLGAISLAVALFANPITWGVAIVATAAIIAAVVKTASAVVSVADNTAAFFKENDDPGAARYYGNTSSLNDFAKKHVHDKKFQSAAEFVDNVGAVAEIVAAVGSLGMQTQFTTVQNADGSFSAVKTTGMNWSKSNVKSNLLEQIGVSTKYTAEGTKYSFKASDLFKRSLGIESSKSETYPNFISAKVAKKGGVGVYENLIFDKASAFRGDAIANTANRIRSIDNVFDKMHRLTEDTSNFKTLIGNMEVKDILGFVPIVQDFVDPVSTMLD